VWHAGGKVTLRGNAKVEGGILRAFMTCPSVTAQQLASIACPVLLGMGPHERGALTEFLQLSTLQVAQALPNCKLERYASFSQKETVGACPFM
jgi:hypothetical protein